jgi:hypothetical protein
MHDSRYGIACAAVAGFIIVLGGYGCRTVELYDEVPDRWLAGYGVCVTYLATNLGWQGWMGSALLYHQTTTPAYTHRTRTNIHY